MAPGCQGDAHQPDHGQGEQGDDVPTKGYPPDQKPPQHSNDSSASFDDTCHHESCQAGGNQYPGTEQLLMPDGEKRDLPRPAEPEREQEVTREGMIAQ